MKIFTVMTTLLSAVQVAVFIDCLFTKKLFSGKLHCKINIL